MADDLINLLLAFLWCYTTVPHLVPKDCRYRCNYVTVIYFIVLLFILVWYAALLIFFL